MDQLQLELELPMSHWDVEDTEPLYTMVVIDLVEDEDE